MKNKILSPQKILKVFTLVGFLTIHFGCSAQQENSTIKNLEILLDSIIGTTMESQDIPGATYILVSKDKTLVKKGFGFSGIDDQKKPTSPDSTIFRIGSISKTFTAAALIHLADQNKIDLDADVNNYLNFVRVPSTFEEPITARHLLTHSAGLDELRGRRAFDPNDLIPLDTFLMDRLVRLRRPGMITSYSSYAIALAGLLVEDISGVSLEEYLDKNIWSSLDMNMTSMVVPDEQKKYVSYGFEQEGGVNIPVDWEWYHTYPASEINSTAADMGKYMQMLLNTGLHGNEKVLSKEMASAMTIQQLSTHDEVGGFAFGFYQRKRYGVATITHGGNMLGYSSMLTLIPAKEIGLYIVNHHEGSNLRNLVVDAFLKFFGSEEVEEPEYTASETDLSVFVGSYRWMTFCNTCEGITPPRSNEITVNSDNTLSGFGRKFYEVKPLLFKSFDGQRTMGFVKDQSGKVKYMSLGNINTFEKVE